MSTFLGPDLGLQFPVGRCWAADARQGEFLVHLEMSKAVSAGSEASQERDCRENIRNGAGPPLTLGSLPTGGCTAGGSCVLGAASRCPSPCALSRLVLAESAVWSSLGEGWVCLALTGGVLLLRAPWGQSLGLWPPWCCVLWTMHSGRETVLKTLANS